MAWLVVALSLAPGQFLQADVVVLRGGGRVSGKVTERSTHVEVVGEGGVRTYLIEAAEKILRSPQEVLGGAERSFQKAKARYKEAVGLSDSARQDAILREALAKVKSARDAYASARELFPEDRYAPLEAAARGVEYPVQGYREPHSVARP